VSPQAKTRTLAEDGCQLKVVHLRRVQLARRRALPPHEIEAMARLLKAAADPTRLRILTALMDGEMCVCDLAAFLGLSQSAVSHQLRRLRDLELVRTRREGPILYYALNDAHVVELVQVCRDHVRH